jgi:hypothetical protein
VQSAAYNSRIFSRLNSPCLRSRCPGTQAPLRSRRVGFALLALAWLLAMPSFSQNWPAAEEQLAGKIVSITGPQTITLEVVNRSSLNTATTDDIRRNLLTELAVTGIRFAPAQQATAAVRVSLSDDLQNYVWVAEIQQGTSSVAIAIVSFPRSAPLTVEPVASAQVLHKIPLWSQPERILDVAVIDGNPARMFVLDGNVIAAYRLQDSRWQKEQSLPIVHSRPWPRDLRGRLMLTKVRDNKDFSFEAYLPGVHCRSSAGAPATLACYENDDSWPVGTDLSIQNASFASTRNFFSGALSPGVGQQTTAPAFYSAAAVSRPQTVSWLLAAVDGRLHLLDGNNDQVLEKLSWGSDVASVRSGCGSGWQVLATGSGSSASDTVQAFELTSHEAVAASAPLDVNGSITSMWSESSGTGAVAVAHNSEMGSYEAFRLILTCGH